MEAGIAAFYFFFGAPLGLAIFFAPTEAAPSRIVHGASRGVGSSGGLLGVANLRLG